MKENKILKIPKQYSEDIDEEYISDSGEFDGSEDWEADYYYYNKGDWNGLIKYREKMVKNYPENSDVQWQLGEAYVLNSEFEKALEFLGKLYYKDPQDINVQHSILDALFGLDRNETDLLEAILNDGRFIVDGEDKLISEKYISVSKNKKN